MRRLALVVCALLLGCDAGPADTDKAEGAEGADARQAGPEGWVVPAGQQARFEEDRKECVGQAVARTTRRVDVRDFERCMEGRGWKRK